MNQQEKQKKVYTIFETISKQYDRANDRISFGQHRVWKRKLAGLLAHSVASHGPVLDLCCGTGDISLLLAQEKPRLHVVGCDFSPHMLNVARKRGAAYSNLHWVCANAMELPFQDNVFAASVISFGLRNTPNYKKVLQEMVRVTKPGGLVACLESSVPESAPIRFLYRGYFKGLMPLLGGGKKRLAEYRWLSESTKNFLTKKQLLHLFWQCGLQKIRCKSFLFGVCALHTGTKERG